jgi:hypothetical protein
MWLNMPHEPGCKRDDEECTCKIRDWDKWYDACDTDEPNWPVIHVMNALAREYIIVIMTGRSQVVSEKTREWLNLYRVSYHNIFMRPPKDYTEDVIMKLKWAEAYGFDQILCVYEDRERMVNAWREKGVACFQVAPGKF